MNGAADHVGADDGLKHPVAVRGASARSGWIALTGFSSFLARWLDVWACGGLGSALGQGGSRLALFFLCFGVFGVVLQHPVEVSQGALVAPEGEVIAGQLMR